MRAITIQQIKNLQQKIQNSIRKIEKNISNVFRNQDIFQNTNKNQDILIKTKIIISMLLDLQTIIKNRSVYAVLDYINKHLESVKINKNNNNKDFYMRKICNNKIIGEQIEIQQVKKSLEKNYDIVANNNEQYDKDIKSTK